MLCRGKAGVARGFLITIKNSGFSETAVFLCRFGEFCFEFDNAASRVGSGILKKFPCGAICSVCSVFSAIILDRKPMIGFPVVMVIHEAAMKKHALMNRKEVKR